MNIEHRLQKIGKELSKISRKMEISISKPNKPKDRKGDYVIIKEKNYKGRNFIALLLTDPYEDWKDEHSTSRGWTVYFMAENAEFLPTLKGDFYKALAIWDSKRKIWIWHDRLMKDVKTYKNWNPPVKLLARYG